MRVLGQEDMLKEVVHDLGMALIRRGRAELNTLGCGITPLSGGRRGRPTNLQCSNSVIASSAGMLSPRSPSPSFPSGQDNMHMLSSFRVGVGKRSMYERDCVICGGDTSWFCALDGITNGLRGRELIYPNTLGFWTDFEPVTISSHHNGST